MAIDRRQVLQGVAAGMLLPWSRLAAHAAGHGALFAAAYRESDGGYGAALFDETGAVRNSVSLPARGHGFAVQPGDRRVVAFARRPGNFAVCWSCDSAQEPAWFSPPEGRHFYGHGMFSPDGRVLYATENESETGRGLIGLYDATAGFRSVGAFSTGGIGPHDLALMPGGRCLVVANGGIRTHPDQGREPLNIDTMSPSLAYLDVSSGAIVETVQLAPQLHKLSLRHLAVNARGLAVIGCQHKGPRSELPDLVVTHRMGATPQALTLPPAAAQSLNNYVSSVAMDLSGRYAAITSSKCGIALIVDLEQRRLFKQQQLADVSGVAANPVGTGAFLVTAGTSAIGQLGLAETDIHTATTGLSWDNHVVRVV